jgi:acetylornithine deacetylase/succinyl-diaminopimelate desuccinylase-like protein
MMKEFAIKHQETILNIIRDLCHIPAPSFGEERRAEYCKAYFESFGAEGVYIDEVNNVIFPLNCEGSNEITVIAAHTDTVFPDTECYPEFHEDEERIYCPGVGDDTASVAALMLTAKYFVENKISPKDGFLFVCNSCEEGLGNLVGVKQVFKDYEGRVKQFVTIDSQIGGVVNMAVGSHRYEVIAETEGGHSFSKFGNKNAIAALSEVVCEIYKLQVPKKENTITTYNVGNIEGGTSVNTIAQKASMLCEYRSNDRECLAIMKAEFERIFAAANTPETKLTVNMIGNRPCKGEVDPAAEERLINAYRQAVEAVTGEDITLRMASTDANIPMSLGIPAIDVGSYIGAGAHRREEYIEKTSLVPGLEMIIRTAIALAD